MHIIDCWNGCMNFYQCLSLEDKIFIVSVLGSLLFGLWLIEREIKNIRGYIPKEGKK